jgi:hypothetical protein
LLLLSLSINTCVLLSLSINTCVLLSLCINTCVLLSLCISTTGSLVAAQVGRFSLWQPSLLA